MKLSYAKAHGGRSQDGINMVDLMMWLVIAALLLAAAIQGIGYYQKAAYLYQMQSDMEGAGTVAVGMAAKEDGVVSKAVADEAVVEAQRSAQVQSTVELASNGTTPYLRATHPGVDDKDVLYLFDACSDTYKIGVNVVPKGGTPTLASCGIAAGGTTSGTTTTGGTSTSSGTSGTTTVDTSAKCYDPNSDTEATCWMNESITAQLNYEASNSTYFGSVLAGWDGTNTPFSAPELTDLKSPLIFRSQQGIYRDSVDPTNDTNKAINNVVARNGDVWQTTIIHYLDGSDAFEYAPAKTGSNINYGCKFVTPADLIGDCLTYKGLSPDTYRIQASDNDATADADIRNVLTKETNSYLGGDLYGTLDATTDVQSWAGTTYDTKIWITSATPDTGYHRYLRVMVRTPNGDIYSAQQAYYEPDHSSADDPNLAYIYRHTATYLDDVCTAPYTGGTNQAPDVQTCSTYGYTNFHP